MKILLIDTDESSNAALREALTARGLEVLTTGDGKAGMDLAKEGPAAIILSVELGDKLTGGYAWCQKLKKDDELKKIPLVLISAQATPKTFEEHKKLKVRAEEYLIKPFASDALVDAVARHVELPEPAAAEPPIALEDDTPGEESIKFDEEGAEGATMTIPRAALSAGEDDLGKLDDAFDSLVDEAPAVAAAPASTEEDDVLAGLGAETPAAPEPAVEAAAEEDPLAGLTDDEEATTIEPPVAPRPAPTPTPTPAPVRAAPATPAPARPAASSAAAAAAAHAAAAELSELRGQVAELTSKLEAAEQQLGEQAAVAEAAKSTSGSRDKEFFQLKQDKVKQDKEILRLKQELTAKEQEALDALEKSTGFEEKIAEFEGELAKKDALIKNEKQRAEAAVAAAKKAEAQLTSLRAEASQVPELAGQVDALTAERDAAQAELAQAQGERDAAQGERDAAQAERDAAQGERDAAQGELSDVKAKLSEVEGQLGAEKRRADDLLAQLDEAREATAASEAAANDAKARVTELEGESARNEERVVKAYQKIKTDEKVKDKTKKALAIALQLLEEHGLGEEGAEDEEARS